MMKSYGIHSPRLDTIEMVEKLIQKKKTFPSKNQLWRNLPKQMQYPTMLKILNYLEQSNKIVYDKKGAVVWIFANTPKLKKMLSSGKRYR